MNWAAAGVGNQSLHPLCIPVDAHGLQPSRPATTGIHPPLRAVPPQPRSHTPVARARGGNGQPGGSRHAPSRDFKAGSFVCVRVCSPPLSTAALIDVTSPRDVAGGPDPAIVPGLGGDVRLLGGGSWGSQACFHLPDLPRWRKGSSQGTGLGRGVPTAQQKGHE